MSNIRAQRTCGWACLYSGKQRPKKLFHVEQFFWITENLGRSQVRVQRRDANLGHQEIKKKMFHVEQFFWKLDFFVFFGVSYFLAKRPTSAKQQMWSTACPTKCSTWNIFFGSNLGKAAVPRRWISGPGCFGQE